MYFPLTMILLSLKTVCQCGDDEHNSNIPRYSSPYRGWSLFMAHGRERIDILREFCSRSTWHVDKTFRTIIFPHPLSENTIIIIIQVHNYIGTKMQIYAGFQRYIINYYCYSGGGVTKFQVCKIGGDHPFNL